MGIDDSEVSRLLHGDVSSDDPDWGEVSNFLDSVETAYPAASTTAYEGRHLAAVANEVRLVQHELRRPRQGAVQQLAKRTRRILAGSVGAGLIVLTAGVGVAAALGINPLEQLMNGRPPLPPVTQVSTPAGGPDDPAGQRRDGEPGTVPPGTVPSSPPSGVPNQPSGVPNPASTSEPGSVGDEHKSDRATEKANNANTPTLPPQAKPSVPPRPTPTPKAEQSRPAQPPRATPTKPTPRAKPPEAPPSGKGEKPVAGQG